MRAVILVGRGQATPGSGAALIRLAARCRTAGIAPVVTACFLRHQRPAFAEALEQCVAQGAQETVIVPYALSLAEQDRAELERLAEDARLAYPHLALRVTEPLGHHPALAQVLVQRAIEADYAAHHLWTHQQRDVWSPWHQHHAIGLVVVLDGQTGVPPMLQEEVLSACRHMPRYADVHFCVIDQNELSLTSSLEALTAQGCRWVILAPYMLEPCTSLVVAIERTIAETGARHPDITLIQAEPLAYDRRLLKAIADRVQAHG
ncbi:MAG: CbiX/SirB N-terminal domain-containing protein [Roseiflexaceae bacterium]|nr:cobalamin biosynthesis protein CbiX [Roseiflexus sp.]MDW8214905.1 CbiX/SirB N-terminal domain-containing protein [Roseiflexaceae bacterium]